MPARTLFAAWPKLDTTWRPRNPYKGLVAFGATDRADFFGRADLIPRLADQVQGERLTTLIGPSGERTIVVVPPKAAERGYASSPTTFEPRAERQHMRPHCSQIPVQRCWW